MLREGKRGGCHAKHLDGKLDSARWWSISIFFAVVLGSLAIACTIYFAK